MSKSNDLFESLKSEFLLNVKDIPYIIDSSQKILFIGNQAKKLGINPNKLIGTNFIDLIYTPDKEKVISNFKKTIFDGITDVSLNFRVKTKKGIFYINENGFIKKLDEKNFIICGLLRDMTKDRKKLDDLSKFTSQNKNPIFRISKKGEIMYLNEASQEVINVLKRNKKIKIDFDKILKRVNSTKQNKNFICQAGDKYFSLNIVYIDDENYTNIYGRDVTFELEHTSLLIEKEKEFESLFQNMTDCFAYHKILLDENQIPIDYEFVKVNKAFEKMIEVKSDEIIGKKVTELIPNIKQDNLDWIKEYGEIALKRTKKTFQSNSDNFKKTFLINAYSPKKGYFATVFKDISDEKKDRDILEAKIKELETLNNITTERELKMIELKERIKELKERIEKLKEKNK